MHFRFILLICQLREDDGIFGIGRCFIFRELIFEPVLRILFLLMHTVADSCCRSADCQHHCSNQHPCGFIQLSHMLFLFHSVLLDPVSSKVILWIALRDCRRKLCPENAVDLILRRLFFPEAAEHCCDFRGQTRLFCFFGSRFLLHMKLQIFIQILLRQIFHQLIDFFILHSNPSFRKNVSSFLRVRSSVILTALLLI